MPPGPCTERTGLVCRKKQLWGKGAGQTRDKVTVTEVTVTRVTVTFRGVVDTTAGLLYNRGAFPVIPPSDSTGSGAYRLFKEACP